jgi:thiamine biosynthesis protein ThiC
LALDPETVRELHDETLPQEGAKTAHFPVSPTRHVVALAKMEASAKADLSSRSLNVG